MKFLKRLKKQKEMVSIYQRVFKSKDGQVILSDLMEMCGMQRSSFDTDPNKMAYYEGQRSVILRILKTVNVTEKELQKWFKIKEEELQDMEEHNHE